MGGRPDRHIAAGRRRDGSATWQVFAATDSNDVDAPDTWRDSGTPKTFAAATDCTIRYKDITNWATPANSSHYVKRNGNGSSVSHTATYLLNTAPVITSTGGGDTAAIDAAENQTAVTTVAATDSEVPPQTLTYSIIGGADAAKFSIVGATGVLTFVTAPNYEAKADANDDGVCEVIVQVSDGLLTDTQTISVTVTDVNEPPTVTLANTTVTELPENTDTSVAHKVADIVVTDDALGTNDLSISGPDAALFEIVGSELRLKQGPVLDFETNLSLDVTVAVDDAAVGATPDATAALAISVTDVNEAPVAVADSYATDEDTQLEVDGPGVLVNDTDADEGDTLSAVLVDKFGGWSRHPQDSRDLASRVNKFGA